ncbi:MAG: hypothetical protein M1830_009865 [Pleopsidium flavum]|nr:MAG: hypothetical protein M1830_009865 [Pleopsidium flavum]
MWSHETGTILPHQLDVLPHLRSRRNKQRDCPVALLTTCHQINQEATPHLYQTPRFLLQAPHQAYKWVRSIGPRNCGNIRTVNLKSSFLSGDVDKTGRNIAAETWALILRSMPRLRQVEFDHETNCPSWSDMAYRHGHTDLAEAIEGLSNVEYLRYMDLIIGDRSFELALLRNKPRLRVLEVWPPLREEVVPPTEESMRTKESVFDALPRLQVLSIRQSEAHLSPGFFLHVAPLRSLKYSELGFATARAESIVNRHGTSLQHLWLRIAHCTPLTSPLDIKSLAWMLQNLQHLEFLCLYSDHLDSSILAFLPPTLQTASIIVKDTSPIQVEANLRSLSSRCEHLKHLRIEVIPHRSHQFSNSLPYPHDPPDFDTIKWEPYHRGLRYLRSMGLEVTSPGCDTTRCNINIDAEHIDQSGLIP